MHGFFSYDVYYNDTERTVIDSGKILKATYFILILIFPFLAEE